ncbi:hypothetical protein R3P38DRAFT_1950505 [Favolaschia claudopus]|uniref:Uncharacterized protein n=1 Tax=Favolaschia claudopus TaxID=2862362 RepID=A0AAW0A0K0_9AGAR
MDYNAREDREIRDLIRQASASRDKSGDLRRKTLSKLIDLTHTQKTSLKILAANNIPNLFNDFPDQEENAINAIYDLCEDQHKQGCERRDTTQSQQFPKRRING